MGALLAGSALVPSATAYAADALKFGPPPAWVRPQLIPNAPRTDAPVAILLNDQQLWFEPGKTISYSEGAVRIQNAQGLAAGNLSVGWDPANDTLTINKLQIRRGDKIIDVLASGQTFQTMRRETNLEAAMLDGTLTANIQPEGLQEGDIVVLATTTEHSDTVLKGHGEAIFAGWNDVPIAQAHASISWPKSMDVIFRKSDNLPQPIIKTVGDRSSVDFSAAKVEPLIAPSGAPARFRVGRIAEASDFKSWNDLAELFVPLFREASTIPASGPLHDEVEKIRSASSDPKTRAEAALRLVQDRIRYVALSMGQGGYVPATAESTWSRRFGDCKAKTALLLGILHSLGMQGEPVLVNSRMGDAINDRIPMPSVFNHVLVRAHIAGKDYWLDGTRTGDTSLDDIQTPNFGWGLPLVADAQLVHIVPPPLTVPADETVAEIDATGGVHAAAPTTIDQVIRGDVAVALNTILSAATEAQRQEFLRGYFKKSFDDVTMTTASFAFDKAKRELHLSLKGEAKLDWSSGYYHVPNSSVGYAADFARPAGPDQDAPFAVSYPTYSKVVTKLRMPRSFLGKRSLGSADVHETLAGIEYVRSNTLDGDTLIVETVEKGTVPEVSSEDARAAQSRLRALSDEDVWLPLPGSYQPTAADLAALLKDETAEPTLVNTANSLLNARKFDDAIVALDRAIQLKPNDVVALADRGIARVWKGDFSAAKADFEAAQAIDPDNAIMLRGRGLMFERQGDCASAVDAYTKSLRSEDRNSFALGHRAICEKDLGRDDEALADAEQAVRLDSKWLELRLMRANILLSQGKRDAVAAEADLLVQDNPKTDFALVAAGKMYARIGMQPKAMDAFARALTIKPEAYIYLNRAQARPAADYQGRMSDLEAALKLKPDDVDTMAQVADEYERIGDHKRALMLYDRLVIPTPGFSDYAVLRAGVLHKLGRTAEAEKAMSAQRAKAKAAGDLNNLCWTKAINGILLESALQDCREALKLKPDNGPYFDSLGMVLLKLGKLDEAMAAYDRAVAKRTGADSLMGRALVYARKGDRAHADADAEAARKIYPEIDDLFARYGLKLP